MQMYSDEQLDKAIQCALQKNSRMCLGEKKMKIPDTNTYTNSLNVLVGNQNRGKTYTAVREIKKICDRNPLIHMIIYINRAGSESDGTFEGMKEILNLPIKYVSEGEALKVIKDIIEWKEAYTAVVKNNAMYDLPQNMKDEMFEHLYISDFSRPYLHTVCLTDDASKMELMKNNEFANLLTQLRHIQFTIFINVHFFKALSTVIKSNVDTLYLFSGFSRQQLQYILYQCNACASVNEIYPLYRELGQYDKIVIDQQNGNYHVQR